ncbi:MAG: potassium channel protein [Planctomycetes bacterium]|nr:potassium channel protein [Planctomycetota bacterium]
MKSASSVGEIRKRLLRAAGLFFGVFLAGGFGYYFLSPGEVNLLQCFYMTAISLTTVGYGEVVPVTGYPSLMIFTSLLLLVGVGILTYSFGVVTAFLVEGTLDRFFWRSKMARQIHNLVDHYVVCGVGETGIHAIHELQVTRAGCVVVDSDAARFEALQGWDKVCWVEGDATDDQVLESAGIGRAAGLLACLPTDRDNLFLVLTARQLNPRLRIVAKCVDPENEGKFMKAGADACVSPQVIGGLRLVSQLVRPTVVGFLDLMLRERDKNIRIEEVKIAAASELVGRSLKDAEFRQRFQLQVLALRPKNATGFVYSPGPEEILREGMTLVVMGEVEQASKLRTVAESTRESFTARG